MLPPSKELFLIKEKLIKQGKYDPKYVDKQEKKLKWTKLEFGKKKNERI